jgi:hypothetical protein
LAPIGTEAVSVDGGGAGLAPIGTEAVSVDGGGAGLAPIGTEAVSVDGGGAGLAPIGTEAVSVDGGGAGLAPIGTEAVSVDGGGAGLAPIGTEAYAPVVRMRREANGNRLRAGDLMRSSRAQRRSTSDYSRNTKETKEFYVFLRATIYCRRRYPGSYLDLTPQNVYRTVKLRVSFFRLSRVSTCFSINNDAPIRIGCPYPDGIPLSQVS